MTDRLPLFPLGAVLYPGLVLPLHVFEQRYRRLVRDLIALPADEPRRFGVVAIRQGREVGPEGVRSMADIHPVGCTAELRQIDAHEDGRFELLCTGGYRFRVEDLDHSLPYLQGEVTVLPEVLGADCDVLGVSVTKLFGAYRGVLLGDDDAEIDGDEADTDDTDTNTDTDELPADVAVMSYLVAAAMVLDLADKQRLLESDDVAARLRTELALLRRELTMLRLLPSLPAVDLVRAGTCPN